MSFWELVLIISDLIWNLFSFSFFSKGEFKKVFVLVGSGEEDDEEDLSVNRDFLFFWTARMNLWNNPECFFLNSTDIQEEEAEALMILLQRLHVIGLTTHQDSLTLCCL